MQSKGRTLWIGFRLLGLLLWAALPNLSLAENAGLDGRIQAMLAKSLPRLACNLSNGSPGSIVASPQTQDPNYYFHWIRDSALVIQAISRLLPYVTDTSNEARIRELIGYFVTFSSTLQHSATPYGFGETRFNVDGSIDQSRWPRPQFDRAPSEKFRSDPPRTDCNARTHTDRRSRHFHPDDRLFRLV